MRRIEIHLPKRDVTCIAKLLQHDAPRTCDAVWDRLPLGGEIFHAKYARNELYTFTPPVTDTPLGLENPTVTPIPGDVVLFEFGPGMLPAGTYGYDAHQGGGGAAVVDLAVFYGRNNLLLNADIGFVPGNVFATVTEGLDDLAAAGNDVWRAGAIGEELWFRRHGGDG